MVNMSYVLLWERDTTWPFTALTTKVSDSKTGK